ncbi:Cytochrome c-type biogenesis protein CcmF [Slackia heliotrinireducens]|uniref:Cytochrome c biogenesis factor n=1 Tax=Slackia heliotrinireducens (strain ATCC 29202 / DSM 20476 / NCTC 11029 / RHS 1) TaxID=471855 RepID=C7N4I6_SLAHD|nr:cytochrome c biogenesis protein CcsA [Slackia heliotrinireducens]ACV21821.1 cytochrome c biogenesis factor [Slackia heliotrinireducens DSM 20476]VEG99538.1 Cytochrome c-type biogenesis protein CcmF [Slackia heliotrinireducens]
MATYGYVGLLIAFMAAAVSVASLLIGRIALKLRKNDLSETLYWAGGVATVLTCVALTFCCALLVFCFLTENYTIEYVLMEHSDATGPLGVLFDVSGLWAGREGSLLFWAWLISVYNTIIAVRTLRKSDSMDSMAIMVSQVIALIFIATGLFSESGAVFEATGSPYMENGKLTMMASVVGMSPLLEHWAQAVHPPTLFIGYAGLTIPFAYAMAAIIENDASEKWVNRASGYTMFSWLFLGIGIGLGAIWAYVVLGWGGYWGWDPVENASLFSWMIALALVHCFTVYRQRGGFKRWAIMCATLAFAFVIVGTFITRSGIVQSVHAFAEDPVSLAMFGTLIVASVAVGVIGVVLRWKTFESNDDIESMMSKNAAYYFNNVIMVIFTFVLCYLTVSSALPEFLPFGGQSLGPGTYNAIARPLGIVYCLIIAVCPLLAWGFTDREKFVKQIKVPAILAVVLFVALAVYWALVLLPSYNQIIDAGGTAADSLMSEGPSWYYNGLALVGFAVASLLFFTTLMMIVRNAQQHAKATGKNAVAAFFHLFKVNPSRYGGFMAHFAMSIILIGLIGSSMYITEVSRYVPWDETTNVADPIDVEGYELNLTDSQVYTKDNDSTYVYEVTFDVTEDGKAIGSVTPSVSLDAYTQQTKLNASIVHKPYEDLFVVYRGVSDEGDLAVDVRINRLIVFVWVGFGLLMLGTFISTLGYLVKRKKGTAADPEKAEADADEKPAEA